MNKEQYPPLKAFILCAGHATRFYPHTKVQAKALIPFLNVPLVFYNLYLLKNLGVQKWLANTRIEQEALRDGLLQLSAFAGMIMPAFSVEEELLGSAGGLWQARSFFEKERYFYYLNGDSFIWPMEENTLSDFYEAHVKSQALASFLSIPSQNQQGVLWADDKNQIHSFLKKPESSKVKAYDFCGLALLSGSILNELKQTDRHIFKDVLENLCLKKNLRVHICSNVKMLDMNKLSSYLQGVEQALASLNYNHSSSEYLKQVLDNFSSGWCTFSGEGYVSATELPSALKKQVNKQNYLFCGRGVKGLENLSVKNFAILGDHSIIEKPVTIESSVLAEKMRLQHDLSHELVLEIK